MTSLWAPETRLAQPDDLCIPVDVGDIARLGYNRRPIRLAAITLANVFVAPLLCSIGLRAQQSGLSRCGPSVGGGLQVGPRSDADHK